MKLSSLFIVLPAVLSTINASSTASSSPRASASKSPYLNELELEELAAKSGMELEAWINEKRLECDTTTSEEYSSSGSGSNTPIMSPKSSSPSSSASSASFIDSAAVSKFDQKMLLSLSDALRLKNRALITKLINCIPNWKMTFQKGNFSVLSLIAQIDRKKYLGKLIRPDALEYFQPLISGRRRNFAGAYFLTLSLFHPSIQTQVMELLIENAPNLRGIFLINSIYYNLNESILDLLIRAGAKINFSEIDDISPLKSLPNFDKSTEDQVSITKRLFMNFSENFHQFASWERLTSRDAEINFLYGMIETGLPDEIGALRVAFENYSPEFVMKLVQLSPMPFLTNYHLAHLLARNPEKRSEYPSIESLVDPKLVFDRLSAGESDLIALAYLSTMNPTDQVQIIAEFLSKTSAFNYPKINNEQTFIYQTSKDFMELTGIPELPSSPALVFFVTACKCNIADEAFALIWKRCKNSSSRQFMVARKAALTWAKSKRLTTKTEIMTGL